MVDAEMSGAPMRVRIWDLPIRLFHWTLVPLLGFAWWTAEERMLDWHRLAGYSIFALLLFRLIWGFAGSSTARFSNFVGGPSTLLRYVRGHMFNRAATPAVGHNPVGGWSVIAMITILAVQVGLGFFFRGYRRYGVRSLFLSSRFRNRPDRCGMARLHLQRHSCPHGSSCRRRSFLPSPPARQSCRTNDQRNAEMVRRSANAAVRIGLERAYSLPADCGRNMVVDRPVRPGLTRDLR